MVLNLFIIVIISFLFQNCCTAAVCLDFISLIVRGFILFSERLTVESRIQIGSFKGDFKDLVKQTPVDDLQIKEYPFVGFRINANTRVEVFVTYMGEPKNATATRTAL